MDLTEVHQVNIGKNFIDLPKGVNLIEQPNGTYDLIRDGNVLVDDLNFNPDGSIPKESLKTLEGKNIQVTSVTEFIERTVSKEVSQLPKNLSRTILRNLLKSVAIFGMTTIQKCISGRMENGMEQILMN